MDITTLTGLVPALDSAIDAARAARTAGSALFGDAQVAEGAVEQALRIEASGPDGEGPVKFSRPWRRRAVPVLADWLRVKETARLFLDCGDTGVSDELVSAMGEQLRSTNAGLDADRLEALACSFGGGGPRPARTPRGPGRSRTCSRRK